MNKRRDEIKSGSRRTNEPLYLELASATSRRLAALFLHHKRLSLGKMYEILWNSEIVPSFTQSALRSVLRRWIKRRILLTDGFAYILNPVSGSSILIDALRGEEAVREQDGLDSLSRSKEACEPMRNVTIELNPRWWSEVFDFPARWKEKSVIRTHIGQDIAQLICQTCEQKPRVKDRAKRHVHREKTFVVEVFPRGKTNIWTKTDPTWLDKLGQWLEKGGLGTSDLRLVASAIENELTSTISTLEIPNKLSSESIEQWNLQIEYAGRKADLRLVRSHFGKPYGETEIRSDERYHIDWLGMVTGASLTVMKDDVRIESLEHKLKALSEELQDLKKERDALKKKPEKGDDSYYV